MSLQNVHETQRKTSRDEKSNKKVEEIQETIFKMVVVSSSLSVTTLNVNRLNTPIEIYRLAKWMKKQIQIYATYKRITLDLRADIR